MGKLAVNIVWIKRDIRTIDHDSLKNETVTIRDRDSMKQDRVKIEEVKKFLNSKIDISIWLKKLSW